MLNLGEVLCGGSGSMNPPQFVCSENGYAGIILLSIWVQKLLQQLSELKKGVVVEHGKSQLVEKVLKILY